MFTIDRDALLPLAGAAAKIAGKGVRQWILLRWGPGLTVCATDGVRRIDISSEWCKATEAGALCVGAKDFMDAVAGLPVGGVSVRADGNRVKVAQDRGPRSRLIPSDAADGFPAAPAQLVAASKLSLTSAELGELYNAVGWSASTLLENRSAMLIEWSAGRMTARTNSGHCIAAHEMAIAADDSGRIYVPAGVMKAGVLPEPKKAAPLALEYAAQRLCIRATGLQVYTLCPDEWPDIRSVTHGPAPVLVPRAAFVDALATMRPFCHLECVTLTYEADKLLLRAATRDGSQAEDELPARTECADADVRSVSLNAAYAIAAASPWSTEEIAITIPPASEIGAPFVMTPWPEPGGTHAGISQMQAASSPAKRD